MDDAYPKTTTVLAIDLPGELGERLRRALRGRPGQTLRDLTLEALEEWLDRHAVEEAPGRREQTAAFGAPRTP